MNHTRAPVDERTRSELRMLLETEGERATIAHLRLSRLALYRALSALPVTIGVRTRIAEVMRSHAA